MHTCTVVVEPDEEGDFYVMVPALPECFTRGRTIEECQERAAEAIEAHIAGLFAEGEPAPEELGKPPSSDQDRRYLTDIRLVQ